MFEADAQIIEVVDRDGRPNIWGEFLRLHIKPQGTEDGRSFRITRATAETLHKDLTELLRD